ncbi:MAG: MBL fold metallo-hydrolase [Elusimicrobiales bacterium]
MTLKTLKTAAAPVFLFTSILIAAAGPLDAGVFDALKALSGGAVPFTPSLSHLPPDRLNPAARPLKVYFINVGQGDSTYIELPDGKNALIDGGPDKSETGNLALFLSSHSVTRIDNVVLTHPHSDHYTGLQYVFSKMPVSNFFDTQVDNAAATGDEAVRTLAAGAHIVHPSAGDTLPWDENEVGVKVLNACSFSVVSSSSQFINDCSIVLRITYQNISMLFTGDMQDDVEAGLVKQYGGELKSEVLKVGHHGSRYSSSDAFLAAVQPHDAYVSVGQNNYGHPTPSCLARLKKAGAVVRRTDLDGTMEYAIGGTDISPSAAADGLVPLKY